jgi:ribosome-binding protein aMBF1 (putative translation factor)
MIKESEFGETPGKCLICQKSVAMYVIEIAGHEIKVCYQCYQKWEMQLKKYTEEENYHLVNNLQCVICKSRAEKIRKFNKKIIQVCEDCDEIMSCLYLHQFKNLKELRKKVKEERIKRKKEFLRRIKEGIENLEILWGKFSEDSLYGRMKQELERRGI